MGTLDYRGGSPAGGGLTEAEIEALIDAAVAGLLDGAPGALDTLNELAAALADDASFAATVTTALAAKIAASTLTADGDLLTRTAGVPAPITRAALATALGIPAFSPITIRANLASDTTSGTGLEAWGATEIVVDDAAIPGPVTIEATLTGFVDDIDPNEFAAIQIGISIDGGSNYVLSSSIAISASGLKIASTTDDRFPFANQHLRPNVTPTGDVKIRGQIQTPGGAGLATFTNGILIARIRPASALDAAI